MDREQLEEIALAIEAAGNTAYKTTHWHSAPGYMDSARIVRQFAILAAQSAPEPVVEPVTKCSHPYRESWQSSGAGESAHIRVNKFCPDCGAVLDSPTEPTKGK